MKPIFCPLLALLLAGLGLAQHPPVTPKGPKAVTNAGELDRRASTPALAQAVILAKALMAQSPPPVATTQATQTTLVSDLFAAPAGTLLEAHAGSYAWSHAGGDPTRCLSSNGDGSLSATGPGTGLYYLYGAPLPPLPTVALGVDPEADTDEGGPMLMAAGGASYAFGRCSYPDYRVELVVVVGGKVVDDVVGSVYWGAASDSTLRLSSAADGSLTLRLGDGVQVPPVSSSAARGVTWSGAGIHADRLRSGTPTRFSSFSISGGPSGTPGILHTRVYRVDVWATSDAAAIATARSSTTGGLPWPLAQYPLMRFVSEAYEAGLLPPDGTYPSATAIATSWATNPALTVDLGPGAQWGYAPDDLPVAEIGPRVSAAASAPATTLFHVYQQVREAFPTPDLATAQAAQASYYAAWVAFGGPLPGADYLAALPFSAPAAADGSVSFASTAGKTIKVMPLPWAAMRANAVPLSDAWSAMASGAPTFAIPIDPAMVLPVNLLPPNP